MHSITKNDITIERVFKILIITHQRETLNLNGKVKHGFAGKTRDHCCVTLKTTEKTLEKMPK